VRSGRSIHDGDANDGGANDRGANDGVANDGDPNDGGARRDRPAGPTIDAGVTLAPLLTGLGTHCAERLAHRLAERGLAPAHLELLRAVAGAEGSSQQDLANRLGILPSRMVGLIDGLEAENLLERVRNRRDRRQYTIVLTDAGAAARAEIDELAAAEEAELTAPLSAAEHRELEALLRRIAAHAGLDPAPGAEPTDG
jgi:DNA-binding MarR family transcriptional regulator